MQQIDGLSMDQLSNGILRIAFYRLMLPTAVILYLTSWNSMLKLQGIFSHTLVPKKHTDRISN